MADEPLVVRGIDWRETFPFTNIFRAFRVAIHPSKLVLALAALLLMYVGGRFLDGVWPQSAINTGAGNRAVILAGLPLPAEPQLLLLAKASGPFISFFKDEAEQVNLIARDVITGNWSYDEGLLGHIAGFVITGPLAYLRANPLFFTLLFVWFLLIWAIFGGAIARIAAVHVARDEKLSVRQALKFSFSKLLSFVFAPLIPLVIVLAVGAALAVGGALLYVPYVGPVLVGALFILALAAGFVVTLLVLGTAGGFNLMYPTIAVEGSDSFDAISRSFSYVYARPWRMAWYTLVAVVYGALTYLFVRLFLFLMLGMTHYFVSWFLTPAPGQRWDTMWPGPLSFWDFTYRFDWANLSQGLGVGAALLSFWIYLVVALLGAFVISFYFSANTIIYYLMRQEVDATELDDVYLEQSEEEFAEPAASEAEPAPAAPAASEPQPAMAANAAGAAGTTVAPETLADPPSSPAASDNNESSR